MATVVDTPESQRLLAVLHCFRAVGNELEHSRRQSCQRQKIPSIVLEHCGKWAAISRSHELKVPPRNFKPRHIVMAARAEYLVLERSQRAAGAFVAPESPSRMKRVHVVETRHRAVEAVVEISRLENRRVERLAVEAHDRACIGELARESAKQGAFPREGGEKILTRDESAFLVKAAKSDEKRVGAGASAQAGRLEIEKYERRPGPR